MIATQAQAREIIASIYGPVYAADIRFPMREGPTVMTLNKEAENAGFPTLAWRRMDGDEAATVWLGRYLAYDLDGAKYFDWNWEHDAAKSGHADEIGERHE